MLGLLQNTLWLKNYPKPHVPMSALEVLQSCSTQQDALLATLGSIDSSSLMAKFHLSDVKIFLPYHVALLIDVIHGGKTIGRAVVD